MSNWYLGKIKYSQEQETGGVKQISESFLIDAVSYSDAEARLYEIVVDNTPESSVDSIARQKLSDVFTYEDGDIFFKIKTAWDSVDEVKGKTKKIANSVVLNAKDISQAIERLNNEYKNMLVPYEITDINTTAILEVCRYEAKGDLEKSIVTELFNDFVQEFPSPMQPIAHKFESKDVIEIVHNGEPVMEINWSEESAEKRVVVVPPPINCENIAESSFYIEGINGHIPSPPNPFQPLDFIKNFAVTNEMPNDKLYGFTDHLDNFQKRQELKQEQPE